MNKIAPLLLLVALTLSACTDIPAGTSDSASTPAPTPALAPVIVPTVIIPAPLPSDEVQWAEWALRQGYRWCAVIDGQQMLMGEPDGPRPIEATLSHICP